MQRQPHSSFSQPSQPIRKPISEQLLRLGALLLGLDALGWAVLMLGYFLSIKGQSAIADLFWQVGMPVLVFGVPAIFVGVLLVLIGATIRWLGASGSLVPRISGLFSIGMGLLAWVPYLLVPDHHIFTTLIWITGVTALLVGLPLPILGLIFLVIGIIRAAEEDSSQEHP